jgi:hypothetical protein
MRRAIVDASSPLRAEGGAYVLHPRLGWGPSERRPRGASPGGVCSRGQLSPACPFLLGGHCAAAAPIPPAL